MFAPKMIGIAPESGMIPLAASDNARPITAALERTSAVNTAATRNRMSGCPVRAVRSSRNSPLVASGAGLEPVSGERREDVPETRSGRALQALADQTHPIEEECGATEEREENEVGGGHRGSIAGHPDPALSVRR